MNLKHLKKHWNAWGKNDPFWSILASVDKKGKRKNWAVDEFFKTGNRDVDSLIDYIESLGISLSRGKAMDFGCGVGRLTQRLAFYFDEVFGVDISSSMIELARKYNVQGDKCRYFLNEMDNLNLFFDGTFDLIYTNITLQHMKPCYAKNYIKEFLRVLAPGGVLVFQQASGAKVKSTGIKQRIETAAPEFLLSFYWSMKLRFLNKPRFEMYGIGREEMIEFLGTHGGKILDIREDGSAGSDWVSYRYCMTKGPM